MFYSGADPVTLLDDLRELGQAHITAHADQVPPFASLQAEQCYLWWEILLVTDRDQAAIGDVFVFVEDECEVSIRLLEDQAAAVALLGSVPPESYEIFLVECEEHLEQIERDALELERDPASQDSLASLFRGVHSIKGNAGLLLGEVTGAALTAGHPLQLLLKVAHGLESLLDRCRGAAAGPVPDQTIQTALETCDAVRTLLGRLTHNDAGGPVSPELLVRLGVRAGAAASAPAADGRAAAFLNTTSQCVEVIAGCLRRLESGAEPAAPVLQTYLRGLKTFSAAAQYRNCSELEAPLGLQLRILDAAVRSGEALGSQERSTLGNALQTARSILERIATEENAGRVSEPAAANRTPAKPQADGPGSSASPSTIRIDQDKLDRLMRVVGELLVARGAFPLLAQKLNDGANGAGMVKELKEAGSNISRIADELQASVMSIRMLPVRTVFQRFPRLVRDLARSLGKEIRLVIEGEGIELDKTILEQIGDPLVHLIRNAVDHGIEPPEERRASGKDGAGQLTLRAAQEAGGVTIEVTDDGRGLDAAALKRKAVEKGLLTPEAAAGMSEEAAFQLIFLPGLTTAAKVTDVSGRGVGMDVVRSNVRNLQGAIEIRSKRGRGTTFLIKLPTSLMISKGILLEAGAQEYILPLSNIRDMVKVPAEEAHEYRGLTLAQVRGNIYSIFSLAEMLGLTPAKTPELSVAIVEAGAVKYGLVVDKFVSEVEVLVKPLTRRLGAMQGISGRRHHGRRAGGAGSECAGVSQFGSILVQLVDQSEVPAGVAPFRARLSAWLRNPRIAAVRRKPAVGDFQSEKGAATLEKTIELLDSLNRNTERDFLGIGEKLAEFIETVKLISSELTALADLISGEHGSNATEALASALDRSRAMQAGAEDSVRMLGGMRQEAGRLTETLSGFKGTVSTFHIIGVLTRIETAQLGSAGADFGNLADDVRALAGDIQTRIESALGKATQLTAPIESVLQRVSALHQGEAQDLPRVISGVLESLKSFRDMQNRTHDASVRLGTRYGAISEAFNKLIVSIQFHDITRQQVEHVIEALRRLCPEPDGTGGGVQQDRDTGAVLALQSMQLADAAEKFAASVASVGQNLDQIAAHVLGMAGESRTLSGLSEDAKNSFFLEMERGCATILSGLGECTDTEAAAQAASGGLRETIGRVHGSLEEIRLIETQVQWMALNASIRADHIGVRGDALGVLAASMQTLASESAQRFRNSPRIARRHERSCQPPVRGRRTGV